YQGDTQRYFAESGGRGGRAAPNDAEGRQPVSAAAPLTDIAALLKQAEQRWPRGVASVAVIDPGTSRTVIELREHGGDSLLDRGASERLRFDGVTGVLLNSTPHPALNGASATYNVFTSLH